MNVCICIYIYVYICIYIYMYTYVMLHYIQLFMGFSILELSSYWSTPLDGNLFEGLIVVIVWLPGVP